jgi:sugar phosphate isomerase/epimerase
MINIIQKVFVSAPFELLVEKYLDRFIKDAINPEIGLDATVLDRFSADDFLQIAGTLHSRNLSVTFHGPFADLSPGSPDPMVWSLTQKRYEQVLRLVSVFKPKKLVCHAGYEWKRYGYMQELWIEKSIEMWSWLADRLADEGTELTLENVFEHNPEDMEIIFQSLVGKNVGFCFDIGHQSAFSRASFEHWIKVLGPYLAQLHLHDNDGTLDQHKAMGTASIDFPSFFKLLKSIRSTPPVITLEPHREEDIVPSLNYLEKVWPW